MTPSRISWSECMGQFNWCFWATWLFSAVSGSRPSRGCCLSLITANLLCRHSQHSQLLVCVSPTIPSLSSQTAWADCNKVYFWLKVWFSVISLSEWRQYDALPNLEFHLWFGRREARGTEGGTHWPFILPIMTIISTAASSWPRIWWESPLRLWTDQG